MSAPWLVLLALAAFAVEAWALFGDRTLEEPEPVLEEGEAPPPAAARWLPKVVRLLVFAVLGAALVARVHLAGFGLALLLLATGLWPAMAYATSFAKGAEQERGGPSGCVAFFSMHGGGPDAIMYEAYDKDMNVVVEVTLDMIVQDFEANAK